MSKKSVLSDIKSLKKRLLKDEICLTILDELKRRVEELESTFFPEKKSIETRGHFTLEKKFLDEKIDYALFSDGACRGNPGPGAFGSMGQNKNGDLLFEISGIEMMTTNNRMEMMGTINALKSVREHLHKDQLRGTTVLAKVWLYTDSKYVVEGIERWMMGWKRSGWKKSDGKEVLNIDLWQEIDATISHFEHLKLIWVKGHNGHPQNEHCDQLANRALDEIM